MPYLIYLLYFLFTSVVFALDIDEKSSNITLLNHASIFIDSNNSMSKKEVLKQKFKPTNLKRLILGYRKDTALWIKFDLHNNSKHHLSKVLEYDHVETENIYFYDGNKTIKGGVLHIEQRQKSLNTNFPILLEADEHRTYYIKVYSRVKPLVSKLVLWNEVDFIEHDLRHQMYLFVFFGIITALLFYNFMLLIFTQDMAYLYYVFYLFGILWFHAFFTGMLHLYILSSYWAMVLIKANAGMGIFMSLGSILFAQKFLNTQQFIKLHSLLKIAFVLYILVAILSYDNFFLSSHEAINFSLLLGVTVTYSGFYALYKGVSQAKYYVFGWTIIMLAIIILALQAIMDYDIEDYHLTYIVEIAFVLETLLFSIALAHRIRITNEEKSFSDAKLISFQREEQARLKMIVKEKTKDLKKSLNEKELLYKELNHRIKNNFMMILSLLKLQIKRTQLEETKSSLIVTKNRIESIASLYEMLLLTDENMNVDTLSYLKSIYRNIAINFSKKTKISYAIKYNLEVNSLLYVGLILNELLTNSFKYAFEDEKGEIMIELYNDKEKIFLVVKDNGKGFEKRNKNSLGLTIVEALVEGQLEGVLDIDSRLGTTISISWFENQRN